LEDHRFRVDAMRDSDVLSVARFSGSTPADEAQLRDELARPWSRLWVARGEDDVPVAVLIAWHVADELHVLNVATRVDRQRMGLARALLVTAIAYARSRHVKHILLEVRRSNRGAIMLYRSVGFFAKGTRPNYYADREDAVEMALLFDPATGAIAVVEDEINLES
jgi:ribosomal-protein-alanine N-acetyltransferase